MPLPFIIAGLAAAAGVAGVGSGIHGAAKMKEANDTMKAAERKHKQNIEYFENESEKTNKRMDKLGELELKILNDFKDFSDAIEKIQNRPEFKEYKIGGVALPKYNKDNKINIMITGATGCGKSSTINALFDTEVAKVGVGVDPETMEIEKYELDNLILWDTPGLGDGKEADNRHAKNIIHKLAEVDAQGNALIDLVLVILDSGTRDLGTSYELINNVIIPNLGADKEGRILVALNQADMAMKSRHWDYDKNEPDSTLKEFLDKKAASVKNRIFEGTGVNVTPIYYSAGYKEEGEEQSRPYNLSKLLYYIVKATPAEKRAVYVNNINQDENMWKDDDELIDYAKETKRTILQSVMDSASEGADIGGEIGEVFGPAGETVGRVIGTVVGGAAGVVKGIGGGIIDGIKDFFSLW